MNIIRLENITENYSGYLRDESRKSGTAETISFPGSTEDVINIMTAMKDSKTDVTTQGARTGITAGAVPAGGHILNLSRMDKVLGLRYEESKDCFILRVQSGLELLKLRQMLEQKEFDTQDWSEASMKALDFFRTKGKWFFPPDPTETSASIGGMAACNASGAQSFLYGPTRNYIEAVKVVLADGSQLLLTRGCEKAEGMNFSMCSSAGRIEGTLPDYNMPEVKNASGYYSKAGMDLVDLFIGSEGTLGVITEIEIKLLRLPECIWGITVFFNKEADAISFIRGVRGDKGIGSLLKSGHYIRDEHKPAAIEFFNSNALKLLRRMKKDNPAFRDILNIPESAGTAIYIEYHGNNRDEVFNMAEAAAEILESCGGDTALSWVATNAREMEKLHFFRHAVPEAVNLTIDERRKTIPGFTKLGTDMAVPDSGLEKVIEMYNRDLELEGLESVIFGHIGNNHAHVNIIPRSMEEYNKGKDMYQTWARAVISMGGTVSAEHGIGKMKTTLLKEMYGEKGINEMLRVKKLFDPEMRLNRGNLFTIQD